MVGATRRVALYGGGNPAGCPHRHAPLSNLRSEMLYYPSSPVSGPPGPV